MSRNGALAVWGNSLGLIGDQINAYRQKWGEPPGCLLIDPEQEAAIDAEGCPGTALEHLRAVFGVPAFVLYDEED